MSQCWHIPSPGPVGVFPRQTVDGRRIRVTRPAGHPSGEHVLIDETSTEWIAVNTHGTIARLADVNPWRRPGETLAEAATRCSTGTA